MEEITVAIRGHAIVILSAKDTKGPITLPSVISNSDKAPSTHGQNAAPKPRLRLDVQVSSDVENELAAMIRKLEPTEQRISGDKVDWTTHLLTLARSLKQQVRDAHETLPPPTHTQSVESGAFGTGIRRLLGREVLQKKIDTTMPSVVASILVRIMENTNVGGGNMDALRQSIAGCMTTVASGKLPKRDDKPSRDSDDKPSKGFKQFAEFILKLKPKDAERPMGYTERTKSPSQLIAILSGTEKGVNDQGVTENGIGAQESALRQVGEQCMQFARRRVTNADDQQKHDKEIGELLQTAKLSVAFTQLNAQQQRAMGSRLGQAANVLAKRHNVQARDVTKSALAKSRAGKTISPNLRQKPE